jgi:hypothetical protein
MMGGFGAHRDPELAPPPTLDELAEELAKAVAAIARLTRRLGEVERASGLYATNADLDGPNGDPTVRFSPNAWRGPDQVGKKYSQAHPGFLDLLASTLAYMAENPREGKERYQAGNRLDARRARSWARRIRARDPSSPEGGEAPTAPARIPGQRPTTRRPGLRTAAAAPETPPVDDDLLPP